MSTRSLATLKSVTGAKLFINDIDVAMHAVCMMSIKQSSSILEQDDADLQSRTELVAAALETQKLFGNLNEQPSHNLSMATMRARKFLPHHVRKSLKWLRENSNDAKHKWESESATSLSDGDNNHNAAPVKNDASHDTHKLGPSWKVVSDEQFAEFEQLSFQINLKGHFANSDDSLSDSFEKPCKIDPLCLNDPWRGQSVPQDVIWSTSTLPASKIDDP
eukprot:gnl/MRDRNA2_/MRDRNA2_192683_c0_seq1.p1 gnl/MRDRNA2_/MRDRNA2_192683_c0~~gnl/MRDRNA2_/MRDRNA2_192683_c0_seq1.p1  ORF type:complete len:219 (+),score=31.38 gnl/MRDRNA2_/MRDRNA2_192683_c0_seq1:97-753(+)